MKESKKTNKYLVGAIVVGLILAFALVLSGTYAFWTITETQSTSNKVIGKCLNVDLKDVSEGIYLENALPITDYEGLNLKGFTFTVTNNCADAQDYRIELDSLVDTPANYMKNEYIATALDYGEKNKVSELEELPKTADNIREKHVLGYETVLGNTTNTHTLKLWVDETSQAEEQLKTFLSKVSISAGQNITKEYTAEECFTFDADTKTITDYDAECGGTDVVIPYKFNVEGKNEPVLVTTIGTEAFKRTGLTSVELPITVSTISARAFQYNGELQHVLLKDGLESIGAFAFDKGSFYNENILLEHVIIPSSVKTVAQSAFVKVGLKNLILNEGLTMIGESAFNNNQIKEVVIPDSVTNLTWAAFSDNQIVKLTLGTGISRIDNWTFSGNLLKEVIIPDNVTAIGDKAFYNVPIEKLVLSNNLVSIGSNAFNLISSGASPITKLIIPSSVTTIESSAFGALNANATVIVKRSTEDYVEFNTAPFGNANVIYEVETTE